MNRLEWHPVDGATGYQLAIYDTTLASTVLDEVVRGTEHHVELTVEQQSHDLTMRVRPLHGRHAGDWTDPRPLPLGIVMGEPRERVPTLSPAEDPGLLLMLTVDTECSVLRQPDPDPDRVVDDLIFGDFLKGGRNGGIGLHMDLLEHFGFRGCFFVDVLMEHQFGQRALERTIEAIATRGHEVELHVHADHLDWSSDPSIAALSGALGTDDLDDFRRAMELSVDLFERRVGRTPLAYRAGGYRIADEHFPVLAELGIRIDSSVQPYYNSSVSDWMRTRTQPFWVGDVLEVPPTVVLLNDRPDAWETRGFQPNATLGDPVSPLPRDRDGRPRVATYVSHSFQLLSARIDSDEAAIALLAERIRAAASPDAADRLLRYRQRDVRSYGPATDEGLVAAMAGILRRIADRPDARCATYAELAGVASRHWPTERHPSTDPMPLLDRRRGIATVTGAQVFSPGLLEHLDTESVGADREDGRERAGATPLRERLDHAASGVAVGAPFSVRLRTLGVPARAGRGPASLAELLFPLDVVRRTVGDPVECDEVVPWDTATLLAWLRHMGFEVLRQDHVPREAEELAALEPFADKLRWLDGRELRVAAVELELRSPRSGVPPSPLPPLRLAPSERSGSEIVLPDLIDPEQLPAAAARLYRLLQPGQEIGIQVASAPRLASRTTTLLALMRAGLEIVGATAVGPSFVYQLIRPVSLRDIRRFAGLPEESDV